MKRILYTVTAISILFITTPMVFADDHKEDKKALVRLEAIWNENRRDERDRDDSNNDDDDSKEEETVPSSTPAPTAVTTPRVTVAPTNKPQPTTVAQPTRFPSPTNAPLPTKPVVQPTKVVVLPTAVPTTVPAKPGNSGSNPQPQNPQQNRPQPAPSLPPQVINAPINTHSQQNYQPYTYQTTPYPTNVPEQNNYQEENENDNSEVLGSTDRTPQQPLESFISAQQGNNGNYYPDKKLPEDVTIFLYQLSLILFTGGALFVKPEIIANPFESVLSFVLRRT